MLQSDPSVLQNRVMTQRAGRKPSLLPNPLFLLVRAYSTAVPSSSPPIGIVTKTPERSVFLDEEIVGMAEQTVSVIAFVSTIRAGDNRSIRVPLDPIVLVVFPAPPK